MRGIERRNTLCSLSALRKFREGLVRISHAKFRNKKDLAAPHDKDSQVGLIPHVTA